MKYNSTVILIGIFTSVAIGLLLFICMSAIYIVGTGAKSISEGRQANELSRKIATDERTITADFKKKCLLLLKSPATAKFDLDATTRPFGDKEGHKSGHVSGSVDSMNSFGATLRTNIRGDYLKKGEEWLLAKVTIGEQSTIVDEPAARKLTELTSSKPQ